VVAVGIHWSYVRGFGLVAGRLRRGALARSRNVLRGKSRVRRRGAGAHLSVVQLDDRTGNQQRTGRSLRGRPARRGDWTGDGCTAISCDVNGWRLSTSATCRLRSFHSVLGQRRWQPASRNVETSVDQRDHNEPTAIERATGVDQRDQVEGTSSGRAPGLVRANGGGDRSLGDCRRHAATQDDHDECRPARPDGSTSMDRPNGCRPARLGRSATERRGCGFMDCWVATGGTASIVDWRQNEQTLSRSSSKSGCCAVWLRLQRRV
jgi:hypothetical protein